MDPREHCKVENSVHDPFKRGLLIFLVLGISKTARLKVRAIVIIFALSNITGALGAFERGWDVRDVFLFPNYIIYAFSDE